MKHLILAAALLSSAAQAYDPYDTPRIEPLPSTEGMLDRLNPYPPTPVMPPMINRYDAPRPTNNTGGYNYFGPDMGCRSDGQTTLCYRR